MNRYTFVEPCGVKDNQTNEIEYFETSTIAKEEMVKMEDVFQNSPEGIVYFQKEIFNAAQDEFFDDLEQNDPHEAIELKPTGVHEDFDSYLEF